MREEWNIRGRWKSLEVPPSDPAEAVAPEPATRADAELAPPPTGTFIGAGAVFQGTLRLKGDFCIDSEFRGSLDTDGCLTVGPSGSVEGDIRAREVIVVGAVVGSIVARRQLVLRSGSRLHGDIETACLEIERHAYFKGRTEMTRPHAHSRHAPRDETASIDPGVTPSPIA